MGENLTSLLHPHCKDVTDPSTFPFSLYTYIFHFLSSQVSHRQRKSFMPITFCVNWLVNCAMHEVYYIQQTGRITIYAFGNVTSYLSELYNFKLDAMTLRFPSLKYNKLTVKLIIRG